MIGMYVILANNKKEINREIDRDRRTSASSSKVNEAQLM